MNFMRMIYLGVGVSALVVVSAAGTRGADETRPPENSTAVAATSDLFQAILARDHIIFHVAFNQCDETEFERVLSADFEFYHDKGGVTSSKQDFLKLSRERRCEQNIGLERRMMPNTMKVFPLYKNDILYGAIQTGEHEFYLPDEDGVLKRVETASYTHVWMLEEGDWKLKRALSYNHLSVP